VLSIVVNKYFREIEMELQIRELVNSAGGATKVALALGVSRQAVWGWCKRGQIGAAHAYQLARLCKVPPATLRPDIFLKKKPRGLLNLGATLTERSMEKAGSPPMGIL